LARSTSATGTTTIPSFMSTTSAPLPFDVGGLCQFHQGWFRATGAGPGIHTLAPLIVEVQEHIADRPQEVGGRQ
jgi:hypothetical protein